MTASLPKSIVLQLNESDIKVSDLLIDMIHRSEKKNPSKKMYCYPGEEWIAERLEISRETVSRAVQKLRRLGILVVINRRKVNGWWQTNLYKLGYWILRITGNLKSLISNVISPCDVNVTHSKRSLLISRIKQPLSDFSHKFKDPPLEDIILRMEKAHPELQKEGEKDD